jgi:hypothetical protein
VDARVRNPEIRRYPATLVVPRHQEDRDSRIGYRDQRLEGHVHQSRRDPAAIEQITPMHNQVNVAGERRRERKAVVGEEVVASPPSRYARAEGQIKPQVRVCNEENAD